MTDNARASRSLVIHWPGWLPPLIDFILILAAFLLGHYVRYTLQLLRPVDEFNRAPFEPFVPYALLFAVWVLFALQREGLYRHARGRGWFDEIVVIGNTATNALVLLMAVSFFLQPLVFSRLLLLYAGVFSVLLLALARLLYRELRRRARARGLGVDRVVVVGAGEVGRAVLQHMLARPDLGFQVVGFVDDDPERGQTDIGRVRALGPLDNLSTLIVEQHVNLVIITLSWEYHRQILNIVRECARRNVQVRIVPDLFQLKLNRVQVENMAGIPLLGVRDAITVPRSQRLVKRLLDVAIIVLASPLWLPVFGIVALAIWLDDGGPIFYGQTRVGEGGRHFRVWKFRSMVKNADALKAELVEAQGLDPRHPKLKHDPRVTRVGRLVRRISLDELPQLINILRGDMSLVGPRPPTPDEVDLYEPWHRQRLEIRGGLTGLWQVSGRSDVPFEEMVLLDLYYIENWSLLLDLVILLRTIPHVLFGNGAY